MGALVARPGRRAALATFVIVFAIGFAPLFGAPGYEHALVSGLVAPSCAAIGAAFELSRRGEAPLAPRDQLLRGIAVGALAALAAFVSSLLHGARVGFCGFAPAVLHFLLTASVGAVLGGMWGAFVAEGARRAKRRALHAVAFAVAAPLLAVLISLGRFYSSPMVFAFDPFVGYFGGTLYDTVVDAGNALWTYRLGSACTIGAALFGASFFVRNEDGSLSFDRRAPGMVWKVASFAACVGGSVGITLAGPQLGHWHTRETIARELGAKTSGPRCDVLHGDELPADAAALLLRDCEEQLAGVEAALGARGPDRIAAFIFRDSAEKKRLMGAADTYIAKPWRREVYLQSAPYPHPVLAHELAHVVAGSFGVGPFRVAGRWGGLVPDPGLIEGVAVAAAPEHDVLSDEEWSRAMLEQGILPKLSSIFSLGFLGESSAKSYTVAGAAVKWLMETRGKAAVRAAYGGAPVEEAFSASWAALDAPFRAYLRTLPISPEALAYAKAKFDRPSVFGRTCPHEVDALVHEAVACRDALRFDRALTLYDRALRENPHELPALLGKAITRSRAGDFAGARRELDAVLAREKLPRTTRDRAEEALADLLVREGKWTEASDAYRALGARVLDEDFGRTLEVKGILAGDPMARSSLEALLLGAPGHGPDVTVGLARLEAWRRATNDPVAHYLYGRNMLGKSISDAVPALREAAAGALPTARLRREAVRQLAIAACITQERATLDLAQSLVMREGTQGASRGWIDDVARQLVQCRPAP